MARYKLTQAADRDFENIFDFGIDRFVLTQALDYQNGMKERFAQLAAQPDFCQALARARSPAPRLRLPETDNAPGAGRHVARCLASSDRKDRLCQLPANWVLSSALSGSIAFEPLLISK